MLRKLLVFCGLVVAVALWSAPAQADTACASGSSCNFVLTFTNNTLLAGTQVTVNINNTGSVTILTFTLTANPLGLPAAIDQVGFNSGIISTFPSGWSSAPAGSMDGFGSFSVQAANGGAPFGTTSVSFTLSSLVTNFAGTVAPPGTSGNEFAVHVRFQAVGSCSGFVGGDGGTSSSSTSGNCAPIPEPGTMALFGSGLLGVAAIIRRRLHL